jgi:hypothetical protein
MNALCAPHRSSGSTVYCALFHVKYVTRDTVSLCRSKTRDFSHKSNANNETVGRNYLSVTTAGICAPDDTCISLIACVHVTSSKPDEHANEDG